MGRSREKGTLRAHCALFLVFLTVAVLDSYAIDSPTDTPPTFFAVTSHHGEEHITGECSYTPTSGALHCDVHDVLFIPPDLQEITQEEQESQKQFASLTPEQLRKEKERFANSRGTLDPIKRQRILNRGPKTKEFYRLMDKALNEQDFSRAMAPGADHAKRTCKMLNQNFELEFKRVGPAKWLANPGPQGICNISKAYELERHPKIETWWKLTETVVSVGDTTAALCQGLGSEDKQVTTWSPEMDAATGEYELPCDFLSWNP